MPINLTNCQSSRKRTLNSSANAEKPRSKLHISRGQPNASKVLIISSNQKTIKRRDFATSLTRINHPTSRFRSLAHAAPPSHQPSPPNHHTFSRSKAEMDSDFILGKWWRYEGRASECGSASLRKVQLAPKRRSRRQEQRGSS
jgi:hypothetical protein